ncbi:hypothetical protein [Thiohalorhabdus methylotrophus]|uniref:Uncharacterized protein n=1 Tax=Thiohalorhabdus methylotrophus TaxID=3242694 RepID=A0ABV4TTP3_9GAMM
MARPSLLSTLFLAALCGVRPAAAEQPPLRFLAEPPQQAVHHHINRITITPETLRSGWAGLFQCHDNMDALGATQIVFSEERTRALEVVRTRNIDRARVAGARVLLDGVEPGAKVCLRAESRVLERTGDGHLVVRNGPFMRRLLDSYFPMHVTLVVDFPADRLRYVAIEPTPRPGLAVDKETGRITVEAWFEGVLRTRLRFRAEPPATPSI